MTAPDDVRARFEAWARRTRLFSMSPNEDDSRRYHDPLTQCAWEGYRAAHADLSGEVRELVEVEAKHGSVLRQYLLHLESRNPTQGTRPRMCDVRAALRAATAALAKFTQEKP